MPGEPDAEEAVHRVQRDRLVPSDEVYCFDDDQEWVKGESKRYFISNCQSKLQFSDQLGSDPPVVIRKSNGMKAVSQGQL